MSSTGGETSKMNSFVKKVKMGKRVEKMMKDKSGTTTGQEIADDDPNKTPEPYTCTGIFEADFTEFCRRNHLKDNEIPAVVIRPKPPGIQPPPDAKSKDSKDSKDASKDPTPDESPDTGSQEDPPPKTYVTKEKYAYFRPVIQVEMENDEKPITVTEIYIRGWKIDLLMVGIFKQCWPTIEKLSVVNLWNVNLSEAVIKEFASFLPQCPNLKTLAIDGTICVEESWALLIGEESLLTSLSLRNNGITDKGAAMIGKALSTVKTCNKNLISLNLSGNKISDIGATSIAQGLRMNRALLSLSLANNNVSNEGAKRLAEVLSRFPLTHEEVVERRKLLSEKGSPDRGLVKSPPPSRRGDNRPGSVRSSSHMDKTDKKRDKSSKKKQDGKKGEKEKEDTRSIRSSAEGCKSEKDHGKSNKIPMDGKKDKDDATKGGSKKDDKWKKGGSRTSVVPPTSQPISNASIVADTMTKTKGKKTSSKDKRLPESDSPEMVEAINPLLEQVENMDNQLWIPGNRCMINLNLSRNNITEIGMKSLLLAVQYQITLLNLTPSPALKGILRMSLNGNAVKKTDETFMKLQEVLLTRDPYYKPPEKGEDNQSLAG
ncbi:leucine-rich repeat-containing protein 71-like isoform X4 [Anneissia japonica]|uniref:leucine-rich repeat-containing protein 71-like isoform X4 n=1 Tax=Anneissia japonica TaxID=1529436 RepID=UPI0014255F02|nr:leucine-rich repeat-containing protein 71-like isoform X4 [Anneissia japonica]